MHVTILWLINERGEILLSQRATDSSSDPGVWGPSVSGAVEPDETADLAAVRETQEELGVDIPVSEVHFLHDDTHAHADGDVRKFSIYYAEVKRSLRDSFVLQPTEVATTKWVSLSELRRLLKDEADTILISSNTQLWERLVQGLQSLVSSVGV
jgi:isopentenyldiphosphate isomerase